MTENPRNELARLTGALKNHLKERPGTAVGARRPLAARATRVAAAAPSSAAEPATAAPAAAVARWSWIDGPGAADEKLKRLREEIGDCRRCPLGASRIQLAFGVGNPSARVMFIGEGPGYAEDRKGEPFVGPAGQLLDKILAATELSRSPLEPTWRWVYIANMVKCHPMIDPTDNTRRGNDRPPTTEEMAVCSPFLMAQIRIVRPRFIVALGATAGKALLGTEEGISKFRGRWFDYSPKGDPSLAVRLLPTYHPAALLRNPNLKKDVWTDMKALRAALESSVA